ncbi:MAG: HoxN/HupN/NixA family nickel/cobalt transporter [Thermoplasmata archaeon]
MDSPGPETLDTGGPPAAAIVFAPRERVLVLAIYLGILAATAVGFAAVGLIARTFPVFIGLAALSYILGLRHGVDADHISAIDNTTRKLLQQGKRPLTVGTWFSLGHSTIVVALIVALVVAVDAVSSVIPAIATVGTLIGTGVSGAFLYLIGLINLVIAIEIYRIFRRLRSGELDAKGLDEQLAKRGFMNRYFGGLFRLVNEPWQIYPVGVLFGLGFDTATEVAIIALTLKFGTGGGAVPIWMVLTLPFLFTCGMVLTDTTDGILMRFAYGWAFLKPIRKVFYNLTITVISILVAFAVGTLEALSVVRAELGLSGGIWGDVAYLNSETAWEYLGFVIIGIFAVSWLVAVAIYRHYRYEEQGFGGPPPLDPPSDDGRARPAESP